MSFQLVPVTAGEHFDFTLTSSRTPAPDLTLGGTTIVVQGRLDGASVDLFSKSIGAGVTVIDATSFKTQIDPADTASISSVSKTVDIEITVTEDDGTVSRDWGNIRVRAPFS